MENKVVCVRIEKELVEDFSIWDHLGDPDLWISVIDVLSKFGGIITTGIAVFAALVAYQQLGITRKNGTANLYKEYLELCFNYPKFAKGMSKPNNSNCDDYSKYCWFVARMLFIFEQVLLDSSADAQWVNTIEDQLKKHKSHLEHSTSISRDEWEPELSKIIARVISR
ncbi:hypothetical protein [Vibrio rotiferianus]|uniref:hypothetical protein n=1 Tax=Vibrio rotiferianus TaxID=190895 RepID=UPI00390B6148